VKAVARVIAGDRGEGNLAIVSHGGVGTFYLCHLKGCPINREERQPGENGGHYYCFEAESGTLVHGWRRIEQK
jgi:broad specificity phosphatase PhoE